MFWLFLLDTAANALRPACSGWLLLFLLFRVPSLFESPNCGRREEDEDSNENDNDDDDGIGTCWKATRNGTGQDLNPVVLVVVCRRQRRMRTTEGVIVIVIIVVVVILLLGWFKLVGASSSALSFVYQFYFFSC